MWFLRPACPCLHVEAIIGFTREETFIKQRRWPYLCCALNLFATVFLTLFGIFSFKFIHVDFQCNSVLESRSEKERNQEQVEKKRRGRRGGEEWERGGWRGGRDGRGRGRWEGQKGKREGRREGGSCRGKQVSLKLHGNIFVLRLYYTQGQWDIHI